VIAIDLYPPGSPGPLTPSGSPGDSAPYPARRGVPPAGPEAPLWGSGSPAVSRGGREGPPGPRPPESPISGIFPKKALKRASPGLPGPGPPEPRKRNRRAPARGVDVKPLSGEVENWRKWAKMPKIAKNGQKAHFSGFWAFLPVLGGFEAPGGSPGPRSRGGFTSTPRGGAPRYPAGARVGIRAAQARGIPRRGSRGSPPGRSQKGPGCPRTTWRCAVWRIKR